MLNLRKFKWMRPLLLVGLRAANALSKFALSLYIARYLGLSDLGLYGLIVAGSTILPAFAGFGTNDWIGRQAARLPFADVAPLIFTRLLLSSGFYCVVLVIAIGANYALGGIFPWHLTWICSLIVVLELLADDVAIFLMYRGHAVLGNILLFLRAGLWPGFVILAGLLSPDLRTLDVLLLGWLAGLVIMWALTAIIAQRIKAWQHFRIEKQLFTIGIRASVPFYLKDMSVGAGLYLDRFLVSAFLGLELSGVYTFFWSIANVVHNITLSAIYQPNVAGIIRTATEESQDFRRLLSRAERHSVGFAVLSGVALTALMPFIVAILNKPLLAETQLLFAVVVAATILRLSVDCYNYVLVALHLERLLALLSIAAVPTAAVLQLALIPAFGIFGAAWAYLLAGAIVLTPRLLALRRSPQWTFKPSPAE